MTPHESVSKEQWTEAMRALVIEEKALTRQRDRVAEQRRALPWVKVDKEYVFQDASGPVTLAALFDGRSQLIVYHFMFGPEWDEGCTGCSLMADHVDGARQHFEHNDVSYVAVSRGPIEKLLAYRARMGWGFRWVSSAGGDFNADYHVSFPHGERGDSVFYNFETRLDPEIDELPGISVFYRAEDGAIYHSYSSYARGGESFLGVYAYLDIVPKGRNEARGGQMTDWLKRHDRYEDDGRTRAVAPAMAETA
ncbi:MAG: thioredoxin family protein [Pseudomonadota bacterium]